MSIIFIFLALLAAFNAINAFAEGNKNRAVHMWLFLLIVFVLMIITR